MLIMLTGVPIIPNISQSPRDLTFKKKKMLTLLILLKNVGIKMKMIHGSYHLILHRDVYVR